MSDQLQLRGGSTQESVLFTGAEREVTVDTDLHTLRVHDGTTLGGHIVELATSAANSRNVVAADAATAREALRVALEAAIATAEANRAAAVAAVETGYQAADTTTLASANSYTDTAISDLLGGSPDLLNTLNELAEAIGDDADFITTINNAIAAVQADVDANEAAATTALAAGDAATLTSANSYTDSQVASGDATVTTNLTALVTTETNARTAADTALDARIDVVQADVNQNEADSDAAITAEETRALAAEASITATHTANEAARHQLNLHAGLAFGQLYVGDLIVA